MTLEALEARCKALETRFNIVEHQQCLLINDIETMKFKLAMDNDPWVNCIAKDLLRGARTAEFVAALNVSKCSATDLHDRWEKVTKKCLANGYILTLQHSWIDEPRDTYFISWRAVPKTHAALLST